jgi:hypothetical protein
MAHDRDNGGARYIRRLLAVFGETPVVNRFVD